MVFFFILGVALSVLYGRTVMSDLHASEYAFYDSSQYHASPLPARAYSVFADTHILTNPGTVPVYHSPHERDVACRLLDVKIFFLF